VNRTAAIGTCAWPAHLRPGALRWARPSAHYAATVAFYRDAVGLPVVGEFTASFGEDGTIFGLPDTGIQMEIVRAHPASAGPDGFDQLVLYLNDMEAVTTATAPLRKQGFTPDPAPHGYWAANGAVVFRDPDGRGVVFAPWVYGRDADPVDGGIGITDAGADGEPPVHVDWHDGDRAALRSLFEEAEDSRAQLDGYIDTGRVLVARRGSDAVGHLQLVPTGDAVELKNMAVVPHLRGRGIGRLLVGAAVDACAAGGMSRIVVATAAADTGNLRFYQRCGFRFASVEHDAFTPATGYSDPTVIDGIPLLDRVWLSRELRSPVGPSRAVVRDDGTQQTSSIPPSTAVDHLGGGATAHPF